MTSYISFAVWFKIINFLPSSFIIHSIQMNNPFFFVIIFILYNNTSRYLGEYNGNCIEFSHKFSTSVGQAVACAALTQRARIRFPVGISFLGEVFRGFSSPVRQMSESFRPPWFPEYHLAIIITHHLSLRAPMT